MNLSLMVRSPAPAAPAASDAALMQASKGGDLIEEDQEQFLVRRGGATLGSGCGSALGGR